MTKQNTIKDISLLFQEYGKDIKNTYNVGNADLVALRRYLKGKGTWSLDEISTFFASMGVEKAQLEIRREQERQK